MARRLMKVRAMGLEWGAAFEEAEPIQVSYNGAEYMSWITEGHDLVIQVPTHSKVEWTEKGLVITVPAIG